MGGGGGVRLWGQGRCVRRLEVIVKMQKVGGGGQVGFGVVRVDVNVKIEVFVKIPKKIGGRGGTGRDGSVWGVRVDVNEELKFW